MLRYQFEFDPSTSNSFAADKSWQLDKTWKGFYCSFQGTTIFGPKNGIFLWRFEGVKFYEALPSSVKIHCSFFLIFKPPLNLTLECQWTQNWPAILLTSSSSFHFWHLFCSTLIFLWLTRSRDGYLHRKLLTSPRGYVCFFHLVKHDMMLYLFFCLRPGWICSCLRSHRYVN